MWFHSQHWQSVLAVGASSRWLAVPSGRCPRRRQNEEAAETSAAKTNNFKFQHVPTISLRHTLLHCAIIGSMLPPPLNIQPPYPYYHFYRRSVSDAMSQLQSQSFSFTEVGTLLLVNGTPFTSKRTAQKSYQLNSWKFPRQVKPGKVCFRFESCHNKVLIMAQAPLRRSISRSRGPLPQSAPTRTQPAVSSWKEPRIAHPVSRSQTLRPA